ncbi:MAG: hypothetical protein OXH99_13095 [Bryobacterales bacterium]|nr:hypothetical protein [Bryobacterales bacterium]
MSIRNLHPAFPPSPAQSPTADAPLDMNGAKSAGPDRRLALWAALLSVPCWLVAGIGSAETVTLDGAWSNAWELDAGQTVQIQVGIEAPEQLPENARIEARWSGPPRSDSAFAGERGDLVVGIENGWTKVLHALDPDVFLLYKAPVSGRYELDLETVVSREPMKPQYHRDTGLAPLATAASARTPSADGADLWVDVGPVPSTAGADIVLEAEPNNAPEHAVILPFEAGNADQVLRVVGGADELEYFDNAASGSSPDDWYRLEFRGDRVKLLTANLQLPDPVVSARIRVYKPGVPTPEELKPREAAKREDFGNNNAVPYIHPDTEVIPGAQPVYTYYDGRDVNERLHQQDDNFRSFVTRRLQPGGTYYLRVEANQPGYELEVRLVDPAPFETPQQALKQSIYYHLAEVDAWLIHRPRNIAVHRRVRDGSSLFGENCMSCHTQSGVWGVADAMRHGYRPEGTIQNHRRLVNTMYESLRPTNELVDAAVNTSLAPNDLGDAPAGSRVAGRNVVLHERTFRPKRLHSYQQRRTANYVLQTADPGGINAAGKGSNFGPNVVFKFAAEILERAWRDSGEDRYLEGVLEKAEKIVATGDLQIKVVDDLGHRIEFFHDLLPRTELGNLDPHSGLGKRYAELLPKFERQADRDLQRLLSLQQDDGSWGFDLGVHDESSDTWNRIDEEGDAAPTAVSLIALRAAGFATDSRPVGRAVEWLLESQFEYGLWNRSAQTGFVTNAYVIRALSRLFPGSAEPFERSDFEPQPDETPMERISRARALQSTGRDDFVDLMIDATEDEVPQVRYFGYLGIGGALAPAGIPALVAGLSDPVKACREVSFWSMRQLLLDDQGWPALFAAYRAGDARARQSILQALVMRVDLTGPRSRVNRNELADLLQQAMRDPFPGVRAYAFKAAWHWWVWNPPLRQRISKAWVEALLRNESSTHVENALRYSTASMLIVNGQIANQTGTGNRPQQYRELEDLYRMLSSARRDAGDQRNLLEQRLVAVAATHFQERGGDGGPGQLGYSTPGATELLGDILLSVYRDREDEGRTLWRSIALQGAANVNYPPLQQHLLALLGSDDLDQVAAAAKALSNPSALRLPGELDTIQPLLAKLDEFLRADRQDDAEALVRFLSRVRWVFPEEDAEAERQFFELLVPRSKPRPVASAPFALGRPAPAATGGPPIDRERAVLLGRVLGANPTLHRRAAFDHVGGDALFWLPSTEWMLRYQEGGPTIEEAVEGATEAEDLKVLELTGGRTTEQLVPDGLTSRNTILWWREGLPGHRLTFELEAPEAGRYEVIAAFLHDREMGIVQPSLNGEAFGDPLDFYLPDLTAPGPVSLGVHPFENGSNRFTFVMTGANPDAEKNYIIGLDYVKLEPGETAGSLFTKDDLGVDVIDPIVAAKDRLIAMFTSWFSEDTPEEVRKQAIALANKTALRRNPEVLKALAAWFEREPSPVYRTRIENILNSDDKIYGKRLRELIRQDASEQRSGDIRPLGDSDEWIADVIHFRDYVFAEMSRIDSKDNRACISCHGVPGRVPTLYIEPPDAAGYIPPDALLGNYRRMQQRVDLHDVEKSKFLQKPLNIQSGEEDGHQGGVRYEADAPGYQVIRKWVLGQTELQRQ